MYWTLSDTEYNYFPIQVHVLNKSKFYFIKQSLHNYIQNVMLYVLYKIIFACIHLWSPIHIYTKAHNELVFIGKKIYIIFFHE